MGNNGRGIGRLEMRGKNCEVKAAQPKEAGGRQGKPFRGGDPPQKPSYGLYHHSNPVAFSQEAVPYPYYPPGVPDYMSTMYYPAAPTPYVPRYMNPPMAEYNMSPYFGYCGEPIEAASVPPFGIVSAPHPHPHPQTYAFIPYKEEEDGSADSAPMSTS
jgi:hypothetical protein